jgi:hypothetical protein
MVLQGFIFVGSISAKAEPESSEKVKKVSPWKLSGNSALNFVQSSFSNWAAGGKNAIAGTASSNLKLVYKKEKITWENTLDMAYGLTYQGSDRSKNNDKIDFSSKIGYFAFKNWSYTFLGSFKSQFDKGYAKYPVTEGAMYNSRFAAPAYIGLSLGMDYKPCPDFSLVISPVSSKFTLVLDDTLSKLGVFGVHPGKKAYYEFGAYLKSTYSKKLHDNINLNTKLELFSNLLKTPENIHVSWELKIDMKVTKFISSKIEFQLLYDDKTKIRHDDGTLSGPKVQFKEVLEIGFSYSF